MRRRSRTIKLLKEDWRTHQPRAWLSPGFQAVAAYRIGRAAEEVGGLARRPLRVVRIGLAFVAYTVHHVELPHTARVGRRVKLAHQGGIVIGHDAVIGDDCLIRRNVTIGAVDDAGRSPRLGDRVRIGPGAVLIGDITIGDDVLIGPNAVVTTNVAAGARVLAPSSRVIAPSGAEESRGASRERHDEPPVEEVVSLLSSTFEVSVPIGADTPLLSSGVIDSLKLAVLLDVLEGHFGVAVPPEKAEAGDFDTPRQIAALLGALP